MFECKILNKDGKIKRIISGEEAQKLFWDNANYDYEESSEGIDDTGYDTATPRKLRKRRSLNGDRVPTIKLACVFCKKETMVFAWNQITCSKKCKADLDSRRRKKEMDKRTVTRTCTLCLKSFNTTYPKRLFCQEPCDKNLWRKSLTKKYINEMENNVLTSLT